MKTLKILVWALLASLIIIPIALAVPASQVEQTRDAAVAATNEFCSETGRNEACYGHILLDAEAQAWVNSFSFGDEGDIVDVAEIQSLRLSGMDVETGLWGVALMKLRANLPDNQPEDVTVVLFGDVQLESAYELPTIAEVEVSVRSNVNVRRTASTQAGVIGTIRPDVPISAVARLEDSSWVQILMPESGQVGWVSGSLIRSDDDLDSLNVVQRTTPHFGPMQAFAFTSGMNQEAVSEMPVDGLLIQTPEGAGKVDFFINEVSISLGSTAFIETELTTNEADEEVILMSIYLLEGESTVTIDGADYVLMPGAVLTVELDPETLEPTGAPVDIDVFDPDEMSLLPLSTLPDEFEIVLAGELANLLREFGPGASLLAPGRGFNLPPGQCGFIPGTGELPPGCTGFGEGKPGGGQGQGQGQGQGGGQGQGQGGGQG